MSTKIENQNSKFLVDLKALFIEEQKRSVTLDINQQKAEVERLKRIQGLLDRAGASIGGDGVTPEIFSAITNKTTMKNFDKFASSVEKLGRIPILSKSVQDMGIVDDESIFNEYNLKGLIESERFRSVGSGVNRFGGSGVISRASLTREIESGARGIPQNVAVAKQLRELMAMMGAKSFPAEKDDLFGTDTLFKDVFGKTSAFDNLSKQLSFGFEDGSKILETALGDIQKDVFGDPSIKIQDGFFKLAQIIEKARIAQMAFIDEQNSANVIFGQLGQIPAEVLEALRKEKLSGTLDNFKSSVGTAVDELDKLNAKLREITAASNTESEKQNKERARQLTVTSTPTNIQPFAERLLQQLDPTKEKPLIDPEKIKGMYEAMNAIKKEGVDSQDSLSVHDHHAVPILEEILLTLKGQGQTGTAGGEQNTLSFNTIDTTALDQSINTFSKSITDLSEVMSSPITMEVGGEININVNMTGAEILQENEAAFAQIAGKKVTDGINNFIRNGLRTSNIAIKGDWT